MIAPEFLDTDVLAYAYDDGEPKKQNIARDYLNRALEGEYVVSVQVLAELTAVLLHKFSTPITTEKMIMLLDALSPLKVVQPDKEMVRRAVEAHAQYGLHFYDGMIVAAAERAGCKRIWTEDLNAGQEYFGVKAENPFA
jgi:predicted nucleic acid-binding protein